MGKIIALIGGVVVSCGIVAILFITASQDNRSLEKASEVVQPFVAGVAVEAGDKLKERIKNTPDEQLEKESEILSRKFYHIAKGAFKGHVSEIMDDVSMKDIAKDMYDLGKNASDNYVKPLTKGAMDGAVEALDEIDKAATRLRQFKDENQDLIDSFSSGVEGVYQKLPKKPPLPPPPPLFPPPPFGRPQDLPIGPADQYEYPDSQYYPE